MNDEQCISVHRKVFSDSDYSVDLLDSLSDEFSNYVLCALWVADSEYRDWVDFFLLDCVGRDDLS